jgi:hypothetical protein
VENKSAIAVLVSSPPSDEIDKGFSDFQVRRSSKEISNSCCTLM